MPCRRFFVYILASRSRTLYTGVTRDLVRRVHQHREGRVPGFTRRYNVTRLVYFEETPSARSAFSREHQIKSWSRQRKIRLIEETNAGWIDLAEAWFGGGGVDPSVAALLRDEEDGGALRPDEEER